MIFNKKEQVRFQESSWYIRLWRCRWYLMLPFYAFRAYIRQVIAWKRDYSLRMLDDEEIDSYYPNFKLCWKIWRGTIDYRIGWWYTMDEVMESLKKRQGKYE